MISARPRCFDLAADLDLRPRSISSCEGVSRMAEASTSCSAWASRSAATQSGLALLIGDHHGFGRPGQAVDAHQRRRPGVWPG